MTDEGLRLAFRLALLVLGPLLWWQGRRARARTPRLPEAPGVRASAPSVAVRLHPDLLMLGDSPMAGVGVSRFAEALSACIGEAVQRSRGASWLVRAATGARLGDLPGLAAGVRPRACIVSAGVNDVTALCSTRRWRAELRRLLAAFPGCPVLLIGVPPMHRFPALPWPLRTVLGWRARTLDAISRQELARAAQPTLFVPVPDLVDPALMAEDGFHPSAAGAARLARHVVDAIGKADWWAVLDSNQRPAD